MNDISLLIFNLILWSSCELGYMQVSEFVYVDSCVLEIVHTEVNFEYLLLPWLPSLVFWDRVSNGEPEDYPFSRLAGQQSVGKFFRSSSPTLGLQMHALCLAVHPGTRDGTWVLRL